MPTYVSHIVTGQFYSLETFSSHRHLLCLIPKRVLNYAHICSNNATTSKLNTERLLSAFFNVLEKFICNAYARFIPMGIMKIMSIRSNAIDITLMHRYSHNMPILFFFFSTEEKQLSFAFYQRITFKFSNNSSKRSKSYNIRMCILHSRNNV